MLSYFLPSSSRAFRYFKKPINIFCEFIPQVIFLMSIFGYMNILIISKWLMYSSRLSGDAPSILIVLINMFMMKEEAKPMYKGMAVLQTILVLLAVICIPWMLVIKPVILYREHKRSSIYQRRLTTTSNDTSLASQGVTSSSTTSVGSPQLNPAGNGSVTQNTSENAMKESPENAGDSTTIAIEPTSAAVTTTIDGEEKGKGHGEHGEGFELGDCIIHQVQTLAFSSLQLLRSWLSKRLDDLHLSRFPYLPPFFLLTGHSHDRILPGVDFPHGFVPSTLGSQPSSCSIEWSLVEYGNEDWSKRYWSWKGSGDVGYLCFLGSPNRFSSTLDGRVECIPSCPSTSLGRISIQVLPWSRDRVWAIFIQSNPPTRGGKCWLTWKIRRVQEILSTASKILKMWKQRRDAILTFCTRDFVLQKNSPLQFNQEYCQKKDGSNSPTMLPGNMLCVTLSFWYWTWLDKKERDSWERTHVVKSLMPEKSCFMIRIRLRFGIICSTSVSESGYTKPALAFSLSHYQEWERIRDTKPLLLFCSLRGDRTVKKCLEFQRHNGMTISSYPEEEDENVWQVSSGMWVKGMMCGIKTLDTFPLLCDILESWWERCVHTVRILERDSGVDFYSASEATGGFVKMDLLFFRVLAGSISLLYFLSC